MTETTEVTTAEVEVNTETEAVVDLPTTSEAEHESNNEAAPEGNEPEWAKKRIDKVTAQKYDALKKAEEADARAKAAEERLAAIEAEKPAPVIELPDEDLKYDNPEQYKADLDAYNRSLVTDALNNERKAALTADKEKAEQERVNKENDALKQKISDSAKAYNVDLREVDQSAAVIQRQGLQPGIVEVILQHEASAPLMAHLAKNIGDFDNLNSSTNVTEVVRALDNLAAKSLQRNISDAPDPVIGLEGRSAKEPDEFSKRFPGAQIKRA